MKKKILYTTAYNEQYLLLKADAAEKGGKYFCPVCQSEMLLRKSGNTGKGSKRPHFAHKVLTENCTAEGVLHFSFKRMLVTKLLQYAQEKKEIFMNWNCKYCGEKHSDNLLKKVYDVKEEYSLQNCKPDIALLNDKGIVFAVIEITVTHAPELNVIKYYAENKIILIQITLSSEDDLNNIDAKIANPDSVDFCFNPKCKKCGKFAIKKELVILDENCYNCDSAMKVCYISVKDYPVTPRSFNDAEINFAKSKGVLLQERYSRTENEKYVANVCPRCNAFIGDFYMHDYMPAMDNNKSQYEIGYFCDACNCYLKRGNFA